MKNEVRIHQILMQKFTDNRIAKEYGWNVNGWDRYQRAIALYDDHTWEEIIVIHDKQYDASNSRQPHIANRLRNKTRIEASQVIDEFLEKNGIIGKNLIKKES